MKKHLPILIALFSFFTLSAFAENILTLTNPKTQQRDAFRKGSYLVFSLKSDNSLHEGFIVEVKDSALVFPNAQVSLSQINILAGSTRGKIVAGRVANAIANGLIIAGTAVFDCGIEIFLNSDSYYYWPVGGTVWLAGAVVAGLGYAFDWATLPLEYSVRMRNYKGWDAKIIRDSEMLQAQPAPGEQPARDSLQQASPPMQEGPVKVKKKRNRTGDDVYGD